MFQEASELDWPEDSMNLKERRACSSVELLFPWDNSGST
jgi:hypothetical protein